jgi:putative FmdB family regulatory protein
MPLYEYKCHSCGKIFEVIQKFSDEPITTHEGCGGVTERLISAPAFHLKGSGWYATDYAKKNGGPKSGDTKSDSKTGSGDSSESGSAKSESKDVQASATKSESGSSSGDSKPSTDSKPSPAPSADQK